MIYFKIFLVTLSVSLTLATTNYDVVSRGNKPELRPNNFESLRLPNDTRPLTYNVSLRTWIDQGNLTFTGTVRIGILAVESTNTITLHHRELTIENVELLSEAGNTIPIGAVSYDADFEFLTIPVPNNLTEGSRYFIEIDYRGIMETTWIGFYAIRYNNTEGIERYYASTQFEATNARRTFPCYDEIGLKTNFTIRITHAPSYSAISTMPTTTPNPIQNPDGSEFQETPLMSTYHVAFFISEFEHASSSAGSVPHRIFARPGFTNLTSTAMGTNTRTLDAYIEYFGVDYVLPKMDAVSLPEFPGGMENFGLINYSDYYMLLDDSVDLWEKYYNSVEGIVHEQSHQWFGNLVTPTWWTYTWMKEGFATLFHSFAVDLIYPEWNMKDYMLIISVHRAMQWETETNINRPMTHYVESPEEIDELFDNVNYRKAASVLRMFLFAFSEETFMDGLRLYLRNNMFATVTEEDLFDAITEVVRLDDEIILPPNTNVTDMMASWTRQAGYPFVTVERNYDQGTNQVTLTQERYFNPTIEDPDNTTYWIPYNYATPNNPGFNSSLAMGWIARDQSTVTITVNSLDADDYFLLDTYAGGYYRILYDDRNYRLITDAMIEEPDQFNVLSRASLLENAREFFNGQQLTMTTVLDVFRILENEDNYIAWAPIRTFIFEIDLLFSGHQNYATYREFIRNLVEGLYDSVGVIDEADEPILRKPARRLAINLACNMGSVHCRSDAVRQLRQIIATDGEFHQNIRREMYCAALRAANANDFNFVWNRMLDSQDTNQRNEISSTLGCLTSRVLVNRLLSSLLPSTNENEIEYQPNEAYQIFRSVYENTVYGLEITLDFVLDNAVETYETFGANGPDFLIDLVRSMRRDDLIAQYRELLQIYLEEDLITQATVFVVEEIITENRVAFELHGPVINQWLLDNFA